MHKLSQDSPLSSKYQEKARGDSINISVNTLKIPKAIKIFLLKEQKRGVFKNIKGSFFIEKNKDDFWHFSSLVSIFFAYYAYHYNFFMIKYNNPYTKNMSAIKFILHSLFLLAILLPLCTLGWVLFHHQFSSINWVVYTDTALLIVEKPSTKKFRWLYYIVKKPSIKKFRWLYYEDLDIVCKKISKNSVNEIEFQLQFVDKQGQIRSLSIINEKYLDLLYPFFDDKINHKEILEKQNDI